MDEASQDAVYPDTWVNRAFRRVGRHVPTAAERKQSRDDRYSINGRMAREKFARYSKQAPTSLAAAFFSMIGTYEILNRIPGFRDGEVLPWESIVFMMLFFSLQFLVIPAIRRLHDVGESGTKLLVPWHVFRLLKLPSGPPNKWGDGPT